MRKKRMRAERKRTPPVMPTPRPTLRPVLEEVEEEEAPFSGEEPEPEDEADAEALDEGMLVVDVGAVEEAVALVDGEFAYALELVAGGGDVLGVVEVDPTNSTVVGTEAANWTVVVGV